MPGKSWDNLSSAYRARLARAGITKRDYETNSPELRAKRKAARGHATTPERPERAQRNPAKYATYLATRDQLQQQVIARKARLFGDRVRYNSGRSKTNVSKYRPSMANMRRFLAVDYSRIDDFLDEILAENGGKLPDEWAFIGYH